MQVNELALKAYIRPNTATSMSRKEKSKLDNRREKFNLGTSDLDVLNSMNMSGYEKKK